VKAIDRFDRAGMVSAIATGNTGPGDDGGIALISRGTCSFSMKIRNRRRRDGLSKQAEPPLTTVADRQAASGAPNLNTSLVCGSKRSKRPT